MFGSNYSNNSYDTWNRNGGGAPHKDILESIRRQIGQKIFFRDVKNGWLEPNIHWIGVALNHVYLSDGECSVYGQELVKILNKAYTLSLEIESRISEILNSGKFDRHSKSSVENEKNTFVHSIVQLDLNIGHGQVSAQSYSAFNKMVDTIRRCAN